MGSLRSASQAAARAPYNSIIVNSKPKAKAKAKGPVFDPYLKTLVDTSASKSNPPPPPPTARSAPPSTMASPPPSVMSRSLTTSTRVGSTYNHPQDRGSSVAGPRSASRAGWDGDTMVSGTDWGSVQGHGPPSSYHHRERDDPRKTPYGYNPLPTPAPSEGSSVRRHVPRAQGGEPQPSLRNAKSQPDMQPQQGPRGQVAAASPPSGTAPLPDEISTLQAMYAQFIAQQQAINAATAAQEAARAQQTQGQQHILPVQTLQQLGDISNLNSITAAAAAYQQLASSLTALATQTNNPSSTTLPDTQGSNFTPVPVLPPAVPVGANDIASIVSTLGSYRLDNSIFPQPTAGTSSVSTPLSSIDRRPLSPPPRHRQVRLENIRKTSSSNGHGTHEDDRESTARDRDAQLIAEQQRLQEMMNSLPSPPPTANRRPAELPGTKPPTRDTSAVYELGPGMQGTLSVGGRKESASTIRPPDPRQQYSNVPSGSSSSPGPSSNRSTTPTTRPFNSRPSHDEQIVNEIVHSYSSSHGRSNQPAPRASPSPRSVPHHVLPSNASSTHSSTYSTSSSERHHTAIEKERLDLELRLFELEQEATTQVNRNAGSSGESNPTSSNIHRVENARQDGYVTRKRDSPPSALAYPSDSSGSSVSGRAGRLPYTKSSVIQPSNEEEKRRREDESRRRAKMALPPLPGQLPPPRTDSLPTWSGQQQGDYPRSVSDSRFGGQQSSSPSSRSPPNRPLPSLHIPTHASPRDYMMSSPLSTLAARSIAAVNGHQSPSYPSPTTTSSPNPSLSHEVASPSLSEFDFPLPPANMPRAPNHPVQTVFGEPVRPLEVRTRPLPSPLSTLRKPLPESNPTFRSSNLRI